jgi:hypothetical protein
LPKLDEKSVNTKIAVLEALGELSKSEYINLFSSFSTNSQVFLLLYFKNRQPFALLYLF